ncbi:glycosyl hydrolase catalytic core-domain-containing protein [Xylariaceae sp. FL0255]|nr:glycosyl hydrolase catalytic core-domain-containing protein [Xylariaceae sp. FL0255]
MRPLDLAIAASVLVTAVAGVTSSTHKATSTTKKSSSSSQKTTTSVKTTLKAAAATATTTKPSTSSTKSSSTSKPTSTTSHTTSHSTSSTKPSSTSKVSSTTLKTSTTSHTTSSSKSSTTSKSSSTLTSTTHSSSTTTAPKPTSSSTSHTTTTTSHSTTSITSTTATSSKSTTSTSSSSSSSSSSKSNTTSTTSSTSSTSTPTQTPTSSPAGKRGLGFNDPNLTRPFQNSSDVNWAYNWASDVYYPGTWVPNTFDTALTYVPMLWSAADDLTSIWTANVNHAIATYHTDAVLTFNEPDGCCWSCGNSCMNVSSAVSAYQTWVQPFAGRVKLGAPAVTNSEGSGVGMDYLAQFLSNCTDCTVDFIPLHFYGSVLDPGAFETYVINAWEEFGLPLWITEFGTTSGSEEQVLEWLETVLPWLDAQPYVHRYAYFMDNNQGVPYLLNSDNTTTSIGTLYSE